MPLAKVIDHVAPKPEGIASVANARLRQVAALPHSVNSPDANTDQGSFHRTNLPQLRADLRDERVVTLTKGFGSTVILHSEGAQGSLRRAAVEAGIPAVTVEAGAPLQLEVAEVKHSVKSIHVESVVFGFDHVTLGIITW